MANTPTDKFGYNKPATGDILWGVTVNGDLDAIDADLSVEHRSDVGNHGKHGPKVTVTQTGNDNALVITKNATGTNDVIIITNAGTGWEIKGTLGVWGVTKDGVIACTGITGIDIIGTTGPQGTTGIGTQGVTGLRGITGIQGTAGIYGSSGIQGAQGVTGIQGQTGVGIQGVTGTQGLTGTGTQGVTGPSNFDVPTTDASFNRVSQPFQTVSALNSTTIDWANGNQVRLEMDDSIATLTLSNPRDGEHYFIKIIQTVGSKTISWPSGVGGIIWRGGSPPTLTSANGSKDVVVLVYDSTDNEYLSDVSSNFS